MEIVCTYYGLKDKEFTFTEYEVKDALIEHLPTHHKELLPKTFGSCEIEICEEQSDYEDGKKGEKAKIILTFHNKDIEKKESEPHAR